MNAYTPAERTPRTREERDNFLPDNPNLRVWLENEWTNPAFTKPITGKTYQGKSPNVTYVIKRLTAAFGPIGWGWGYSIAKDQDVTDEKSGTVTNFITLDFFYYPFGRKEDQPESRGRASFAQIGATTMAYATAARDNKPSRAVFDDDAKKKSVSDAITKAASFIGITADLFLGRHDDSKYLSSIEQEDAAARLAQSPFVYIDADGEETRVEHLGAWMEGWRSQVRNRVDADDLDGLRADWDRNRDVINGLKKQYRGPMTKLEDAIRVALGLEAEPKQTRPAEDKDTARAIADGTGDGDGVAGEREAAKAGAAKDLRDMGAGKIADRIEGKTEADRQAEVRGHNASVIDNLRQGKTIEGPKLEDSMPGGPDPKAAGGGGDAQSAAKGIPYLSADTRPQSARTPKEFYDGLRSALAELMPDRGALNLYAREMGEIVESLGKSKEKRIKDLAKIAHEMITGAKEQAYEMSKANTGRDPDEG